MTDLESSLGPQLHRLAADLTPLADPLDQVRDARTRHRRQRRTRAGLTALAAVTAAVVVGGPVVVGSVSSAPERGDVAAPATPTTSSSGPAVTPEEATRADAEAQATAAEQQARLAEVAAARAALAAAREAAAAAAGTAEEQAATEAVLTAQLAEVAAQLDTPPSLSAPAGAPLACPSGAELAGALGGPPVRAQGESTSGAVCSWRSGTDDSGATASIGLSPGTFELYAGGDGVTSGCRVVELAVDVPLQRCVDAGEVTWTLHVPDTAVPDAAGISTSGTWQLSVTGRSGQPQLDPATTLAALTDLAGATWGR